MDRVSDARLVQEINHYGAWALADAGTPTPFGERAIIVESALVELQERRAQRCETCAWFSEECGARWCLKFNRTEIVGFGCNQWEARP